MTILANLPPPVGVTRRPSPGQVWAQTRPNVVRFAAELAGDLLHAGSDAQARAYGLTVVRLPWGGRRIYDARVVVHLAAH